MCNCFSETHSCVILFLIYAARIGARPFSVGEIRGDLEPRVSASVVKKAPYISHRPFHCMNVCWVTRTEIAPISVELRFKNSKQHLVMSLYMGTCGCRFRPFFIKSSIFNEIVACI